MGCCGSSLIGREPLAITTPEEVNTEWVKQALAAGPRASEGIHTRIKTAELEEVLAKNASGITKKDGGGARWAAPLPAPRPRQFPAPPACLGFRACRPYLVVPCDPWRPVRILCAGPRPSQRVAGETHRADIQRGPAKARECPRGSQAAPACGPPPTTSYPSDRPDDPKSFILKLTHVPALDPLPFGLRVYFIHLLDYDLIDGMRAEHWVRPCAPAPLHPCAPAPLRPCAPARLRVPGRAMRRVCACTHQSDRVATSPGRPSSRRQRWARHAALVQRLTPPLRPVLRSCATVAPPACPPA